MSIVPTEELQLEAATMDAAAASDMVEADDRKRSRDETSAAPMDDDIVPVRTKKRRRSTSHLKAVPETLELRTQIKEAAQTYAETLDKARAFNKNELEQHARDLMNQLGLPEKYLGFVMVMIGNFFWKKQFLATPFNRRMLLLPHCLKHAEGCPADYDEFGLDCERCGACSIADYKVTAEKLGYKVLVAEGSPVVLRIIVSGYIDGILGVACLNVLEKAIDKVLIAGVPSYAVPLHSGDCKNTTLDESWIWEVLEQYEPLPDERTASYIPLMRAANQTFEENFERLLPRQRTADQSRLGTPVAFTEKAAYDWLANGGKRFRPFITIAAWDAASSDTADRNTGDVTPEIPDAVARVAMAIEAFHKASLVHDDIQDGDQYRYGSETLHRRYGTGPAINIGDYLIGLGYRLIHAAKDHSAAAAVDILDRMATAHIRLCDGQGAEMEFQRSPDWNITPLDALQIYALKTSPAFEAALYSGLRLADHPLADSELIPQFARHVGVGFQILNDLKDWQGDGDNKLVRGQDALALRPTVLLAMALKDADSKQRAELESILTSTDASDVAGRVAKLRAIFEACGVFSKAETLVDRSRERAETIAEQIEEESIKRLLYFFIDTVLAEETPPTELEKKTPSGAVLVPLGIGRPTKP